jgi:hypothetical protein
VEWIISNRVIVNNLQSGESKRESKLNAKTWMHDPGSLWVSIYFERTRRGWSNLEVNQGGQDCEKRHFPAQIAGAEVRQLNFGALFGF